ncbi:MAG: 3-methyladenine DNA glycosylase [Candidatus Nanopelagicales bacterium]|nr:3-methyladenine DNA glycosylase [Candidatus Nanopelagicales bacterium]
MLEISQWREDQAAHKARASALTGSRRERRKLGTREPVADFMFEYYPYTPMKLETWFPGTGVTLKVDADHEFDFPNYVSADGQTELDTAYRDKHRNRIESTLEILIKTQSREEVFNCFGLHEWAMVYQVDRQQTRHSDPLRVSQQQVNSLVDEIGLRCTHIDAFRFFTEGAAPQNANQLNIIPTRENQREIEQPGCLHANMDLYKHCMWFQPMLPGALVLDSFELARDARILDMQASPYDLSGYGYLPIKMEEKTGRAAYVARQRQIAQHAKILRSRLIKALGPPLSEHFGGALVKFAEDGTL